jgi:hypothetical protein
VPRLVCRQNRTPPSSRMAASTRIGRRFDAVGCLLGPLFPDPNIYRAADLLIWCHGANANVEAARIADTMRGFGDRDEHAFWIRVGQAITERRQADQARRDVRRDPLRAGIMTTPDNDDGVTVTWHATPVGTCALLICRPTDECPSCRPDGRCQHCGLANGVGFQDCTLPKALCQIRPCPVKSGPEMNNG